MVFVPFVAGVDMTLTAAHMPSPLQTSERLRVLLVDDTADVRFLLRRVLESDGRFDVIGEAADGVEGVRLATRFLPDVAVVDLAMPVMDGFQAIPLIRSQSPLTKVVVLTAFRGSHMAAEAAGAGADAYLEKGSSFDGVVTTIEGLYQPAGGPAPYQPDYEAEPVASPPQPDSGWGGVGGGDNVGGGDSIDEILSKLNHELRTPVTIIQGFAVKVQQLATDAQPDMELLRRSADAIERNANVLATMLKSVADARDLQVGRLTLQLEPVELASLVSELSGDLEVVTDDHTVELDLEPVEVRADPVRIRQVVTNLLSNAAKFSPAGTAIEVGLSVRDNAAELSVRDHGPGVPPGKEEEVFGKFTRLASGTKGSGLGLYIARGIAAGHGGELVLENSPSGCRFVLRLPLPEPR